MRLMRSHNLAYFRWFLEHKKPRLHIAVQTGFNAYSGNIKCVLCDRMKWYQNTFVFINHNKTVLFHKRYS